MPNLTRKTGHFAFPALGTVLNNSENLGQILLEAARSVVCVTFSLRRAQASQSPAPHTLCEIVLP